MPKDINLYSFNGPEWDSTNHVQLEEIVPGPEISDTIKLSSQLRGFHGAFGHVVGGREDCVDVNNRCSDCIIEAELWEPRGNYLATIKGGSQNITLRGKVKGHGKVVDIDLGNVADQSDNLTRNIHLDLVHVDGEPITIRVLGADDPLLINAHEQQYKVTCRVPRAFRSLFLKSYKFAKKLGIA